MVDLIKKYLVGIEKNIRYRNYYFCILNLNNIFNPNSKLGNGVAAFDAWRDIK